MSEEILGFKTVELKDKLWTIHTKVKEENFEIKVNDGKKGYTLSKTIVVDSKIGNFFSEKETFFEGGEKTGTFVTLEDVWISNVRRMLMDHDCPKIVGGDKVDVEAIKKSKRGVTVVDIVENSGVDNSKIKISVSFCWKSRKKLFELLLDLIPLKNGVPVGLNNMLSMMVKRIEYLEGKNYQNRGLEAEHDKLKDEAESAIQARLNGKKVMWSKFWALYVTKKKKIRDLEKSKLDMEDSLVKLDVDISQLQTERDLLLKNQKGNDEDDDDESDNDSDDNEERGNEEMEDYLGNKLQEKEKDNTKMTDDDDDVDLSEFI